MSSSAVIESQGDGNLESDMEVKEDVNIHSDSYEGNGNISDERQDDGNMDHLSKSASMRQTPLIQMVGELSQLHDFISSINSNMTPGCKGKLVSTALKRSGLGGAVDTSFTCDGCDNRKTTFSEFN